MHSTQSDVRCDGCGKSFKGRRGLTAHQTGRHVAMDCRPRTAQPAQPETAPPAPSDRDELIRTAHTYSFVPEWHTILVKIEGRDKWAIRMLAEDAQNIAKTADSSQLVRGTKHENSTETTVTDYYWNDGMRIRMTERNAV